MATTRGAKHAKPLLSNALYDILKFLALVVLPAMGAFYFGISEIWNLPYGKEVVGTIAITETFLGVVLKRSTTMYNDSDAKFDGALLVDSSDRPPHVELEGVGAKDLRVKDELTLRVENPN